MARQIDSLLCFGARDQPHQEYFTIFGDHLEMGAIDSPWWSAWWTDFEVIHFVVLIGEADGFADPQLVVHLTDPANFGHQFFGIATVLAIGGLSDQQNLAVDTGGTDAAGLIHVFARGDGVCGFQLNILVIQYGADRASIIGNRCRGGGHRQ